MTLHWFNKYLCEVNFQYSWFSIGLGCLTRLYLTQCLISCWLAAPHCWKLCLKSGFITSLVIWPTEKVGGMNTWAEIFHECGVCHTESLCCAAIQINGFGSNMQILLEILRGAVPILILQTHIPWLHSKAQTSCPCRSLSRWRTLFRAPATTLFLLCRNSCSPWHRSYPKRTSSFSVLKHK